VRLRTVAIGLLLLTGCGEVPSQKPPADAAQAIPARRVIEPPPGTRSTASLARAQVGSESRLVLGSQPRVVLRWREEVTLGDSLGVEVEVPDDAPVGAGLRIDVSASARDKRSRDLTLVEIHSEATRRERLVAEPHILTPAALRGSRSHRVTIPVPADLRGLPALVSALARPLPARARSSWRSRALPTRPTDRLIFGFAVEQEGWSPGWPPVRFQVLAEPASGGEAELLFEQRLDPATSSDHRRWFDASVDLTGLDDGAYVFRFEAEALSAIDGSDVVRSYPVFSAPEIEAGPIGVSADAPDPSQPNIILVSLDTLRARSVGAYGYARDTTPTLDARVAAEGALARAAVAPVPYTPPAHMSMLTGLEPCVHGVLDRHGVLADDPLTLAEVLRAEGYRTGAFTENAYVVAAAGFARGFDHYFEEVSDEAASPGFARETFAGAQRWLAGTGDRPFFLFLHTYQVHDPYVPPEAYASLFAGDGQSDHYKDALRTQLDDYDREIRYTDDLLAGLLDALEAKHLERRTILVVTSDHGEGFGEHYWTRHGIDAHDEAILVPLVIRAPGRIAPGRVVEEPVGLMDLMPTLLELAGAEPPDGLQGRSFASLLLGEPSRFVTRPLVSTAEGNVSVRERDWKLLVGKKKGRKRLYHLASDPDEKRDLAAQHPQKLAELERALAEHTAFCEAWAASRPPRDATAAGVRQPGWLINRDEIEEKLRALGYLE
jgi:arylsulfatase A-like enzyme